MPGLTDEPIEIAGLTISRSLVPHPLLGEAHVIAKGGHVLTHMTPLDWDRPTQIPAIAAPGALPAGTGGAILNAIAERALAAGVPALRYAGPYPTPALYRSLLRSFRASADEQTFTRDLMTRIATLARDEIAVDFAPAPHRRLVYPRCISEVRDGLERVTLDGITFERDASVARILTDEHITRDEDTQLRNGLKFDWVCEVWIADRVYATVAFFAADGHLVDGPWPIRPIESAVLGTAFPPPLRAALGGLVAELVPPPLAAAAAELLSTTDVRWADLGARIARATDDGFEVHAALWERIAPLGMARVALALAEALAPVVTSTLVRRLLAAPSVRPSP